MKIHKSELPLKVSKSTVSYCLNLEVSAALLMIEVLNIGSNAGWQKCCGKVVPKRDAHPKGPSTLF